MFSESDIGNILITKFSNVITNNYSIFMYSNIHSNLKMFLSRKNMK